MSNPTDPTDNVAGPTGDTPGTELEKRARGDISRKEQAGAVAELDEPKSNRTRNILIALGAVVVLAVAAGVTFAVLAPQSTTPDGTVTSPTDAATTAPNTGTGTDETPVDPDAPSAITACTTNNAKASFGDPVDNGGVISVPIIFTNSGDQNRFGEQVACTLEGFPRVEFVSLANGTTIGAEAVREESVAPTPVTLEVDGTARATLNISPANAQDCNPVQADGFRIFFPGATDSFVIETTDYQACQNPEARVILTVGAITAG